MIELTYDQARKLVEAQIEAEGADYVYPSREVEGQKGRCQYFRDGEPSCIVGRVLAEVGVTEDQIGYNDMAENVLKKLQYEGVLIAEPKAKLFLQYIQRRQDNAIPWGEAYAMALEEAEAVFG